MIFIFYGLHKKQAINITFKVKNQSFTRNLIPGYKPETSLDSHDPESDF